MAHATLSMHTYVSKSLRTMNLAIKGAEKASLVTIARRSYDNMIIAWKCAVQNGADLR